MSKGGSSQLVGRPRVRPRRMMNRAVPRARPNQRSEHDLQVWALAAPGAGLPGRLIPAFRPCRHIGVHRIVLARHKDLQTSRPPHHST